MDHGWGNFAGADPVARELRHDARNQLFAMRTALAVLQDSVASDPLLSRNLELCAASLDKLTTLLQEYFALATGEETAAEFSLDELTRQCVEPLRAAAAAMNLSLAVEGPPLRVIGRRVLMQMGLRLALRNALRTAASAIAIGLRRDGPDAVVEISWTIRPPSLEAVPEGICEGIGLAVECLHRGGCAVDAEQPGHLIITLPAAN